MAVLLNVRSKNYAAGRNNISCYFFSIFITLLSLALAAAAVRSKYSLPLATYFEKLSNNPKSLPTSEVSGAILR